MTPDDLDRILAAEEQLVPSSGFAAAVLEQVRDAASAPPPLPFPWLLVLLGTLVVSGLAGLCAWIVVTVPPPGALRAALDATLAALADPRLALAAGAAAGSVVGTYLLVRLSLGFAGSRR